jgi:hypothetical protein
MVARLGHVLGWTGNIVGGLLMLMGAYWGLFGTVDKMATFLFFFVPGVVIFLIGRACRYVLAGDAPAKIEQNRHYKLLVDALVGLAIIAALGVVWSYFQKNPEDLRAWERALRSYFS